MITVNTLERKSNKNENKMHFNMSSAMLASTTRHIQTPLKGTWWNFFYVNFAQEEPSKLARISGPLPNRRSILINLLIKSNSPDQGRENPMI